MALILKAIHLRMSILGIRSVSSPSTIHFETNHRVIGNGTYLLKYASQREFHGNSFIDLSSTTQ